MALTQVNQDPGSPPKKSKLEYFSQGLDMAQSVASIANTGYGMSAKAKELTALEKMQEALRKNNGTMPIVGGR